MKEKQQQGVALVVTLILLSVITFMAVTFLVLSRRNAESVNTLTNQNRARQAADEGVNKAIAQIISRMLANGNGFDMPLLVSTNLIYPGYSPGSTAITNVAYTYANGAPLAAPRDQLQMLNNLLVLPRPPVFVNLGNGLQEFRFYLDLNRNGRFETNGLIGDILDSGQPIFNPTNAALIVSNYHVGDPEWVGILDHPDMRHGASNFFITRYAFICLPAGNALDINWVHNEAKQRGPGQEGFLRNEGVGGWEINLAALLYALNPRQNGNGVWEYLAYDTNTPSNPSGGAYLPSTGSAFEDANSLLQFRYNGNYSSLAPFRKLYEPTSPGASAAVASDGIDWYCVGPLMNNLYLPGDNDGAFVNQPWSGAFNTNQYFAQQDFFGSSPYLANFTGRLLSAGTNLGTTNAYTFYKLLEQVATDGGRDSGKINLNYANRGAYTSTNFKAWQPVQFFTNAANALLAAHPDLAGSSIRQIQVYPTNEYTPALHQLLQLAANIYDATVYKPALSASNDFDYPSVFRPTFRVENNGTIYINDFIEVGPQAPIGTNHDYDVQPLSLPADVDLVRSNLNAGTNVNIYGVPWVIGARKGLPNLNEVSFQTVSQITRKLQIVKPSVGAPRASWHTNVQYVLGITNYVAVEAWNSYSNAYPRSSILIAADDMTMALTNENGPITLPTNTWKLGVAPTVIPANGWPGFTSSFQSNSFILPVLTNLAFIPGYVYLDNGTFTKAADFKTTTGFPQPLFGLNATNRLRFILLDATSGRVIDYVQLDDMDRHRKLIDELPGTDDRGPGGVWDTDRVDGSSNNTAVPVWGMANQIQISLNEPYPAYYNGSYSTPVTSNDWSSAPGFNSVHAAVEAFRLFYNGNSSSNAVMQVPFTPTRIVSRYYTWQANDPLVHYTLSDLSSGGRPGNDLVPPGQETNYWTIGVTTNQILQNIGRVNDRYLPWEGQGNVRAPGYDQKYLANITIKDPLIYRSDDWQFPTNKFPNIGWLGRVHRGTPWQTVYMKSDGFPDGFQDDDWQDWTGDHIVYGQGNNQVSDASYMRPTRDWGIFDLFTTSPNDNATRGQLSINQTNMAAWAALFSGVIVNTNDANFSPIVIDPRPNPNIPISQSGVNNAVRLLVRGIANKRNDFDGNVFTRVGDILSVPELTMQSPFLDRSVTNITDALYERLPQQIMSLLKVGKARYVIYSYGQTLKPAPNSIFTGRLGIPAQFTGTCTNYQIVGEVVTRTVVRFEPSQGLGNNGFTRRNPTRNPVMPKQDFGDPDKGNQPTPRAVIESFTVLGPD